MKRLLVAFVFVTLAGCGPVFFVEAEVPMVCKTFPAQEFPGVPVDASGSYTFPPVSLDFGASLPDFLNTDRLTGNLHIISVEVTARSGVPDLSFIQLAQVTVGGADGSGLAVINVVEYEREPGAAPVTIELGSSSQPNLFPYFKSGSINAAVTLGGTLPHVDWSADLKVCVAAKAKFQYL